MTDFQEQLLIELTRRDVFYQQLLKECEELTPCYKRILHTLPEEDRQILEHYICLCEELEYRRTCLAASVFCPDSTPNL